jgi:hypothetical protein
MMIKINSDLINANCIESVCVESSTTLLISTTNNIYSYKYRSEDELKYVLEHLEECLSEITTIREIKQYQKRR